MQRRLRRRLAVCMPIVLVLQLSVALGWLSASPAAAGQRSAPRRAHAAGARTVIDGVERRVVHLINQIRRAHHLGALRLSMTMSYGAAMHSQWIARAGILSHGAWASRLARFARTRTTGEVVGWVSHCGDRYQPQMIVGMWMHSAEHRRILLSGAYRRVGVGRAGGGRTFFTVDVAR